MVINNRCKSSFKSDEDDNIFIVINSKAWSLNVDHHDHLLSFRWVLLAAWTNRWTFSSCKYKSRSIIILLFLTIITTQVGRLLGYSGGNVGGGAEGAMATITGYEVRSSFSQFFNGKNTSVIVTRITLSMFRCWPGRRRSTRSTSWNSLHPAL